MAAALPDPSENQTPEAEIMDTVTSCPVCTEFYTDPRILNCGHHFCLCCLQKIAESHSDGHVTCPSCRHVTDESPETLSKLRMNEFQVKAAEYVASTFPKCERPCEFCGSVSGELLSCFECRINFCINCKVNHQGIEENEKHIAYAATCHQFCDVHPDRFVQWKCEDCIKTCCLLCYIDHTCHNILSIKDLAKMAKVHLTNDVLDVVSVDTDEKVLNSIENCIKHLRDQKEIFRDLNQDVKLKLQSLLEKLEKEEPKTIETFDSDIKNLEVLQWEAKQFITTKQDLLDYIKKLIRESPDSELLARESSYPKYATAEFIDTIGCPVIQQPVFDKLQNIKSYLQKNIESDLCSNVKQPVHFNPLLSPKFISDVTVDGKVGNGIIYISSLDVLAVYTQANKTLTLFDTYWKKKQQILVNSDVKTNTLQGLGYDPVREMYLLPSLTGDIFTVSLIGEEGKITVIDKPLHGISYSEEDLYVTSSAGGSGGEEYGGTNSVYMINPNTGDIVSTFKPTCKLLSPLVVLCGYEISLGSKIPVIYVSELGGHQIKVIDFSGNVLHVMEAKPHPLGIALDVEGNLLVCLYSKRSVVSYTKQTDGKYKQSTMLRKTDLQDGKPFGLVCDIKRGRIYVAIDGVGLKCFG